LSGSERVDEAEAVVAEPEVAEARADALLEAVDVGPAAPPEPVVAPPALVTARVEAVEGDVVTLRVGLATVLATRDPGLHPVVLAGAIARRERVLVERDPGGAWTVIGALRTQPTPGVDAADEYTIEARRVAVRATEEVSLTAHAASVVVRALGEVETYADRILSRAEGVHKIVGRMLRLN
jgi:hypothetical protein